MNAYTPTQGVSALPVMTPGQRLVGAMKHLEALIEMYPPIEFVNVVRGAFEYVLAQYLAETTPPRMAHIKADDETATGGSDGE